MIKVNVKKGELSQKEIEAYIARAHELYPGKAIESIDLSVDGDFVDVDYNFATVPFQRIRRITGYLVGTLDRFNDAKRSEVEDRVKHGLSGQITHTSQASA
ncbi:MAG: hypothetical protein J5994_04095 [Ruminococcus sp.]|nr:hypothetical protein [Ruminococcus sp.]